tara:strand:+ start:154 stop:366 length:213 start_codon:yes stop_codon:yes gene_type:complete
MDKKKMSKDIEVNKILPYLCKEGGCLREAKYEFTDADEDEKGEYKTIVIGHSCENHVEDVNKMLTKLHKR